MELIFIIIFWAACTYNFVNAMKYNDFTKGSVYLVGMMVLTSLYYVQSTLDKMLVLLETIPK